jgi:hypothetical protein
MVIDAGFVNLRRHFRRHAALAVEVMFISRHM